MERTNNSFVNIDSEIQSSDDVINFAKPLAITDNTRQWNMTKYDIDSLDISEYDGTVTINHGQQISDVVGKVINLRKDKVSQKILVDGIKFAINANPVAVLAKNLMKDGFVSGVSIETIGGDPDETGTWRNHKLSGLSIVAHPNNKNAYAVVANSIEEAKSYGLQTNKLEELESEPEIKFISNDNISILSTSGITCQSNEIDELKERISKIENGCGGKKKKKKSKNSIYKELLHINELQTETSKKLDSVKNKLN